MRYKINVQYEANVGYVGVLYGRGGKSVHN